MSLRVKRCVIASEAVCHCERFLRSNLFDSYKDCFVAKNAPRNDTYGSARNDKLLTISHLLNYCPLKGFLGKVGVFLHYLTKTRFTLPSSHTISGRPVFL